MIYTLEGNAQLIRPAESTGKEDRKYGKSKYKANSTRHFTHLCPAAHLWRSFVDPKGPRRGQAWSKTKGQRMGGGTERPDWGEYLNDLGPMPDEEGKRDGDLDEADRGM